MKTHVKKKAYRLAIKLMAREGLMNGPDGRMMPRRQAADNSMKRDYMPHAGGAQ